MIGQRLAHYEISALLGKGGMGEVYRATDSKLGREVALKVLPAELVRDPERAARFEREARTLAALQHPNVASVYGFEQEGERRFLVMELVEGEELAERIARGPLPPAEAVTIARQVALGLEAAHARGIVHRDLKPANVKVAPDGQVKILDFGLARAVADEPAGGDLAMSPTITAGMTQAGVLLGTAAYMSPEQARGKPADVRTDIWAFGCVLFEMLTGRQAYDGETISDVIARILEREVDLDELPDGTPAGLRRLLRRCLAKDPAQRLHHIADARIELEASGEDEPVAATAAAPARRSGRWLWAVVGVLVAGLAAALLWPHPAAESPVVRFRVDAPSSSAIVDFELSPDGQRLAMVIGERFGQTRMWLREFDREDPVALEGTQGASFPFWSPDSRSIAFFAGDKLRRLDLDGGAVRTLADAPNGRGGAWSSQGVILYTPVGLGPLYTIPAGGGEPQQLTDATPEEGYDAFISHRFPHFLPDGERFTYVAQGRSVVGRSATYLSSLGNPGQQVQLTDELGEVYPLPGQLLLSREGTLLARPFDFAAGEYRGEGLALASGIRTSIPVTGRATFSVSSNGVLAHRSVAVRPSRLVWYDRSGRPGEEYLAVGSWASVRPSPDLSRVVFQRDGGLWVRDVLRGSETRLADTEWVRPGWVSDREIVYTDELAVMRRRVDRDEDPERLLEQDAQGSGETSLAILGVVFAGPSRLVLSNWDSETNVDLWLLDLASGEAPEPIVVAEGMQMNPTVSPDGRWLAYESTQSGQAQVVLQGLEDRRARRVASSGGGQRPLWGPDGRELFYLTDDDDLMVVDIGAGDELQVGIARKLFVAPMGVPDTFYNTAATPQLLAVTERGLLFNVGDRTARPDAVSILMNWERAAGR